nr:CAP domain-containing protein [Propylenella binzhouense]
MPDFLNVGLHRRACLALAGGAGLALAGCAGKGALLEARQLPVDSAGAGRLVSAFRSEAGLNAVSANGVLGDAAGRQALAMARADRLSHRVAGPLPKRLAAVGYDWGIAVENLGAGYRTIEQAMAGWKQSPDHRRNLLREGATEFGIGLAYAPASEYRYFWALVLAMPMPPRGAGGPFGA